MCREIYRPPPAKGDFSRCTHHSRKGAGALGSSVSSSSHLSSRWSDTQPSPRIGAWAPAKTRGMARCLCRSQPPASAGPRERGGRINPLRSQLRPITTHVTRFPPSSRSQSSRRGTCFAGSRPSTARRHCEHAGRPHAFFGTSFPAFSGCARRHYWYSVEQPRPTTSSQQRKTSHASQ